MQPNLWNPPNEVLDEQLIKKQSFLTTASECLTKCKLENFDLAMIAAIEEDENHKSFECTCIQKDFYKFTMQDFSHKCTNIGNARFSWCPDLGREISKSVFSLCFVSLPKLKC